MTDIDLMELALREAESSPRAVRPNPKVGCALRAANGKLIAAFHEKYGGPHAEARVLALCAERGVDPRGATVAVTLEPCSHFGKTPPCADALVQAGVRRVLVGARDPNPKVKGEGLKKLRAAGIEVIEDVLHDRCTAVNREWLQAHRQGYPFVTLKMATSLDGAWTAQDGKSQWITGPSARAKGHALRARVDAILTGRVTMEKDQPRFTARKEMWEATHGEVTPPVDWTGEQPKIFVLSRKEVPDLKVFLQSLHAQGIHDALVEAGPKLTHAFLEAGLCSEIWLFLAPKFLGGAGLRLDAIAQGHLPGLETEIQELVRFPEGDIGIRLKPLV